MSDDLLLLKARELAESNNIDEKQLQLSNGWLQSFKKRYGIRSHTVSGERGSVDDDAVRDARLQLQEAVAAYAPENIFNFDETALFYCLAPNRTLATTPRKGKKKEKQRLTLAFCCTATGSDKLDLVVIGTAQNPRCFKKGVAIKGKPILYKFSKNSWMTSVIFDELLHHFNLNMAVQNRKVLLLVDNASSHKILRDLSHVIVHFLPPKMTSAVQPLDAGVIRSFKARYRKYFVQWCFDVVEANATRKLNVLEAVQFSIDAWAGVTSTIISNCWIKTRILSATTLGQARANGDYAEPVSSGVMEELTELMKKWEGAVSASDYVEVDEEVDVHEPFVVAAETAISDEVEQEDVEDEEPAIQSAVLLRHCMELSAFLLQCEGQTDSERKALLAVTTLVRETTMKAKRQRTMHDYFVCTT